MLPDDQRAQSHHPEKAVSGKMKIMVSACLLGENCKYNGGNNRNQELLTLLKKEKGNQNKTLAQTFWRL